jgi:hypothetical protein
MVGPQGPQGAPGFQEIPQNIQTGNYTLVASDTGKHIYLPVGATGVNYTIPANSSVPFNIGTTITFVNDGAQNIVLLITSDTLVLSPTGATGASRTLAPGGMATILKVTATRWIINGIGLT